MARKICEEANLSSRARPEKIGRHEADALYQAIQQTKISAPATDCISPIGEELILKGLHQVVPGEFYAAATRPPAVYRGNPFLIEVGLAYGGAPPHAEGARARRLDEMLGQSDARTLRQFLISTFDGLGADGGRQDPPGGRSCGRESRPASSSTEEIDQLHEAMRNVNLY